jgi:hypothetical protein
MAKSKVINPFYVLLVVTGVVFGMTALAYGVMAVIARHDPGAAMESIESGHGLVAVMDQHGNRVLLVELAVLAVATVLAIGTDGFWMRRAELSQERSSSESESSGVEGAANENQ